MTYTKIENTEVMDTVASGCNKIYPIRTRSGLYRCLDRFVYLKCRYIGLSAGYSAVQWCSQTGAGLSVSGRLSKF